MLWLAIPALVVTLMITTGLGLLLSALNVLFRDIQHFLELGLLTWFWFTPIVYTYNLVGSAITDRWGEGSEWVAALNPMLPVVTTFQRIVYNPTNFPPEGQEEFTRLVNQDTGWYLQNLGISAVFGLVFMVAGFKVFSRLEANLAEEL